MAARPGSWARGLVTAWRRTAIAESLELVVLVLLVFLGSGSATLARAASPPELRGTPPTPAASRLQTEDKRRVPKPDSGDDKKRQGESDSKKDKDKKESDEEENNDCFLDCLFGLFSGGSTQPAPISEPAIAPSVATGWHIGDVAFIAGFGSDRPIELWEGPGGAAEGHEQVGVIEIGARVHVTETHSLASGEWLRVSREDGSASGWVAADAVDVQPPSSHSPRPQKVSERHPGQLPKAAFLANVGVAFFVGPHDVREEYRDGAFHAGIGGTWALRPGLHTSFTVGYATALGNPQFNYETSTRIDVPQESRVHVTDAVLRLGDYRPVAGGNTRAYWGLGPGVSWVHERARIDFSDLQGGVVVGSGTRFDTLDRVRVSADAATGLLWSLGRRDDFLGVELRGSLIAWSSEQEKSLTFDWIGKHTPVSVGIALVYAFDRF